MNTLGTTANRMRLSREWTREELAQRSGLDENWLARLEQGKLAQTEMAISRLRLVAAAFGYSLVAFLREAGLVEPTDAEPSGDPGLRQLVANYTALSSEEREAVDTLIESLARKE